MEAGSGGGGGRRGGIRWFPQETAWWSANILRNNPEGFRILRKQKNKIDFYSELLYVHIHYCRCA